MFDPVRLATHSLRAQPHGAALRTILAAALDAVEPGAAVARQLQVVGSELEVAGRRYPLGAGRIVVVGAGKAGAPMAAAVYAALGGRVSAGLVVVKAGHAGPWAAQCGPIRLVEAGHPVPDRRGVAGAAALRALVADLSAADLVLVLLSGGGSALLTLPAPPLTLPALQALNTALLRCGAPIGAVNAVRKHCTLLGGGQLARLAQPAQVATLIMSDVVGAPLDVIASGPTVPDPTTYAAALAIIARYDLATTLPASIVAHLRAGAAGRRPETAKPADLDWRRVHTAVIAGNGQAADAAAAAAHALGWAPLVLTTTLEGEARTVGQALAAQARELAAPPTAPPTLLIASGETTVTVRGSGRGGRNQELALAAVPGLAGLDHTTLVALATDGGDGPTDAAGAVVTGATLGRATALGLDPADFLQRSDSYTFFAALGDLLRPGPTLTNVNDLILVAVGAPA